MKICGKCKKEKPISEFAISKQKKDGLQVNCRGCQSLASKRHYNRNRPDYKTRQEARRQEQIARLDEIKKSKKCLVCGEGRFYLLEFHHRNRDEKEFTVGMNVTYSWKRIVKEIEKCDILCANCHRELHYLERNSLKN